MQICEASGGLSNLDKAGCQAGCGIHRHYLLTAASGLQLCWFSSVLSPSSVFIHFPSAVCQHAEPFQIRPSLGLPVGDYADTKDMKKAVEAGQAPVVDVKHPIDSSDGASSVEDFTAGAQDRVKKMEATTTV
jgi:hypothetical protein